jgi:phosphoribosylamine--glycine ligase
MGDPETEVVIPRIKSDIVEIFLAAAKRNLDRITIDFDSRSAATVMLVSDGYPGLYEKGKIIRGMEQDGESIVFHAGTVIKEGEIFSAGGRVLSVTSLAPSLEKALVKSYDRAERISFENKYFRKDIGKDVLNYSLI